MYVLYLVPVGKSYVLTSQKSLVQCMESLTQKLQPGVVISFKKIGSKSSPSAGQENMEVEGKEKEGRVRRRGGGGGGGVRRKKGG